MASQQVVDSEDWENFVVCVNRILESTAELVCCSSQCVDFEMEKEERENPLNWKGGPLFFLSVNSGGA